MHDPESTASAPEPLSHPLKAGQPVILIDGKGRRHFAVLEPGKITNARGNELPHDEIIGRPDGCRIMSPRTGRRFQVITASMYDYALGMTRHAAIVYPKDIATIILRADVHAGLTVVEGGFGSGALSIGLLRAVGETGRVITYELQDAAIGRASKNVAAFHEEALAARHTVKQQDIYDGIDERPVDRVVLDVPEPWNVVKHAERVVRGGGSFAAYIPTVLQMHHLVLALEHARRWTDINCLETIERPWYVSPRSVRPEQSIIGHTGFLVFARRLAPEDDPPPRVKPEGDGAGEPDDAGAPGAE